MMQVHRETMLRLIRRQTVMNLTRSSVHSRKLPVPKVAWFEKFIRHFARPKMVAVPDRKKTQRRDSMAKNQKSWMDGASMKAPSIHDIHDVQGNLGREASFHMRSSSL